MSVMSGRRFKERRSVALVFSVTESVKTVAYLCCLLVCFVPVAGAENAATAEEYLVIVQGRPIAQESTLKFPDVEGRPVRIGISGLPDGIRERILKAQEIRVSLWQIRSGDVFDPARDGWICEAETIAVDGRLVYDAKRCRVHHTRLTRTTKRGVHGCMWRKGDSMSEASRRWFPHGLSFVLLGQLYPRWKAVRAYSCEPCVEACERWERAYDILFVESFPRSGVEARP